MVRIFSFCFQSSVCGQSRIESVSHRVNLVNPWFHNCSTFWLVLLWNRVSKQITGHFSYLKMKTLGTSGWAAYLKLYHVNLSVSCVFEKELNCMRKDYLCPSLTKISYLQVFSKLWNPQVKPCLIPFVLKNAIQASRGSKSVFQMVIHWYQVSA